MRSTSFVLAAAVFSCAAGCSDASDDVDGAVPAMSADAAADRDAASAHDAAVPDGSLPTGCAGDDSEGRCIASGEINPGCLEKPPFDGECAQRDACCRRSSNRAREQELCPDDALLLDYRLNESIDPDRPAFISLAGPLPSEHDRETQNILWRFILPRRDGAVVSGTGETLFGFGRSNCDGTYSYYGGNAAPARPDCAECSQDPARWMPWIADLYVDASRSGRDRLRVQLGRNPRRSFLYAPLLQVGNDAVALTGEVVHQGLEWEPLDLEGEGRDCVGSHEDGGWVPGARYATFIPMEPNARAILPLIGHSYCQVVAFGILPENLLDRSCASERCIPDGGEIGDGGCDWIRLPDSLCPISDDEQLAWDCHLGAAGNPNQHAAYPAELPCTAEPPSQTLDPRSDAQTGQCCDPLGVSDELPACNAWRQVQDYVAAAAAIMPETASELQPDCGIRFPIGQ